MHFFATSAQIASDFDLEHQKVLDSIEKMPYNDFKEMNIQMFNLGEFKIAQMTEPGYNATVFHLPVTDDNRDKLYRFRLAMFQNKAPNHETPVPTQNQNTTKAKSTASGDGDQKTSQISDAARKEAERLIMAGECDSNIRGTFAEQHRALIARLGGDPGYQNVRFYIIRRRNDLGIVM